MNVISVVKPVSAAEELMTKDAGEEPPPTKVRRFAPLLSRTMPVSPPTPLSFLVVADWEEKTMIATWVEVEGMRIVLSPEASCRVVI
jgi:hypothetical protein